VWDMSNGRNLFLLRPGQAPLSAVAFSPVGWRIVTGGVDGRVQMYDCRLCGDAPQLVALAHTRLARLRH
jgi:WD40 repeat protein